MITVEEANKRREELMQGLRQLNAELEQKKVAIEIQKGAITECNFWISELSKEEKKPEKGKLSKA